MYKTNSLQLEREYSRVGGKCVGCIQSSLLETEATARLNEEDENPGVQHTTVVVRVYPYTPQRLLIFYLCARELCSRASSLSHQSSSQRQLTSDYMVQACNDEQHEVKGSNEAFKCVYCLNQRFLIDFNFPLCAILVKCAKHNNKQEL